MSRSNIRYSSMISALSYNGLHSCFCTLFLIVLVTISNAIPVGKVDHSNSTQTFDNGTLTYRDCMDDRGGGTFRSGDLVPRFGPCEECRCLDGQVVCSMVQCEVKPGCQTIQRPNQCCPDYKCECEHNGKVYNNGERLNSSLTPCQVCYCRGGALMCTLFTCYTRDDCEGRTLPGTCCPNYDHCPPLDLSRKGDDLTRNTKREMQPWFMSSPTQPPFTSSTLEANLTTPLHNEHETTDAIKITNADYEEIFYKTTVPGNDLETDYSTLIEQAVSTTEKMEKRLIDPGNETDEIFAFENNTKSIDASNEFDNSIENSTDILGTTENYSSENNETLYNSDINNTSDTAIGIQVDQSDITTVDLNTLGPTESVVAKLALQSSSEQNMDNSKLHLRKYEQDLKTYTEDSIGNNKTDYISKSPFPRFPHLNTETTTKGLQTENSSLKLYPNESTLPLEAITAKAETQNSSSINDPSADSIIEKLTNITSSFMKSSDLDNEHKNDELGLDQLGDIDILIQTNRKLESSEEILILDRSKSQNYHLEQLKKQEGSRLINNEENKGQNDSRTAVDVIKIDHGNVTLPPDIMDDILKISRILLDSGEKGPTSPVREQSQKEKIAPTYKNVEPIIVTDEDKTVSSMNEKIVEKRNATIDTNTTVTMQEESGETKNSESTGGALDAQLQQDLLTSSSDAGKNSEYKLEHFELTESDPISTFTVPTEENLEHSSTDLIENIQTERKTTEFPILSTFYNDDGVKYPDKESFKLDESTTYSYISTTNMNIEETTYFQSETTTPIETGESTTENYAMQTTTTQSESLETTTEFIPTTTDVYYDVTTSDISTPNTEYYTESPITTERTLIPTMSNNEWKIEVSPNQKKNIDIDVKAKAEDEIMDMAYNKTEFPEMRHPVGRDSSSSEESALKSDNSGESGQEIPGFLLNDQFPYLELGGFHISTETKAKNKTYSENMQDKINSVSNNKQIQQLIKDNQHLIIINQNSPQDSKEEDKIDQFASALAKILNEEPTLIEESPIQKFHHKNINFKGNVRKEFQTIESRANILDPVTDSVFEEDTTDSYNDFVTPTNIHYHSELYQNVESESFQPQETCLECSVLAVNTGITKSANIAPIKYAEYDNNKNNKENEAFTNGLSRANSRLAKMMRINDKSKVSIDNNSDSLRKGNSNFVDTQQVKEALQNENHLFKETPIPKDGGYQVHEENEEFTLESPQSLFEIKADRIDEQEEGRLFYDSEKFKKPPEIVYPDEYPEEFIYINSPPLLIVTSTVYTSVPDVMFITTQTTNLGLSYDYLTEEYKGDIFEKKTSKDSEKNLKSESRDADSKKDDGQKNETLTINDSKKELNSSKIIKFKDILPHRISLLNSTKNNSTDENNTRLEEISKSFNETSDTLHDRSISNHINDTITIEPTKESEISTDHFSNQVTKMARLKKRRENQKLLGDLEKPTQVLSSVQLKRDPDHPVRPVTPASRNNARRMRVEETDAEWFIPVKTTQELTQSVNKMTENPDAEWIVPENRREDRRDRPQGRQFPMEENQDAEWITPKSHTNTVANQMSANPKQGRHIPMEENQDAEWITTPQVLSNKRVNVDKRKMADVKQTPLNAKQGRQLPVGEDKDAEWITPQHGGQPLSGGQTGSTSGGGQGGSSSRRQFPMEEAGAEWITRQITRT